MFGDIKSQITAAFLTEHLNRKIVSVVVDRGTNPGDNYMSTIFSLRVVEEVKNGEKMHEEHHWILKCYPSHPLRQEFANKTNMFYKELFIYNFWIPELLKFQNAQLQCEKPLEPAFANFIGGKCVNMTKLACNQVRRNSKVLRFLEQCVFPHVEDQTKHPSIFHPLENFMILKDLRPMGFQMVDRQKGLSLPHVILIIKELAKYHAICWAYRNYKSPKGRIDDIFPILSYYMDGDDMEITFSILRNSLYKTEQALAQKCGENSILIEKVLGFKDNFYKIFEVFYSNCDERVLNAIAKLDDTNEPDELWRVLCHGDCWINNALFRYEDGTPVEVVLVDHAVARELCPTVEIAYLLFTSTTSDVRKDHEFEILQLYHDEFLKCCSSLHVSPFDRFSMTQLQMKYQRAKLYGFATAVLALPAFLKNSEDILDLDNMDTNIKSYSEMHEEATRSSENVNEVFTERIFEIVQEMVETGTL